MAPSHNNLSSKFTLICVGLFAAAFTFGLIIGYFADKTNDEADINMHVVVISPQGQLASASGKDMGGSIKSFFKNLFTPPKSNSLNLNSGGWGDIAHPSRTNGKKK